MSSSRNLGFCSLCLAFFLVMLDTTLVPFLYPSLISELNLGVAQVAAVNNVYLIAYAGVLLLGGKLGDLCDRKFIFLAGVALLGLGSLCAATIGVYSALLLGRFVMGVGAGLITPQSLAFISQLFPDAARGRAFGIWAAVAGVGTALGPIVAKTSEFVGHWQAAFWFNVAFVGVAFALGFAALDDQTTGVGLSAKALVVSILTGATSIALLGGLQSLSISPNWGRALVLLIIAVALGFTSWAVGRIPGFAGLIHLNKLEPRPFMSAVLGSAFLGAGVTAFYLPLSLSFEYLWKLNELTIVTLLVLCSFANSVFGLVAGEWSSRVEVKTLIIVGMLAMMAGCFLLGLLASLDNVRAFNVIACLGVLVALVGVGTGLAFGPLANSSMAAVSEEIVGESAALYNWVRQVFSAGGGVIVGMVSSASLRGNEYSDLASVSDASLAGFLVTGSFLAVGALVSKGVKNASS